MVDKRLKSPFKAYSLAMCLTLVLMYYSYHFGILNPMFKPLAEHVFEFDMEKDKIELNLFEGLCNTSIVIGELLGSMIFPYLRRTLGLRTLHIVSDLYAIGILFLYLIPDLYVFVATRLLIGIYGGLGFNMTSAMFAECFPGSVVGFGNSVGGLMFEGGVMLGLVSENFIDYSKIEEYYKLMLIFPIIFPFLKLLATLCLWRHPTPGHILRSKKKRTEAQLKAELTKSLSQFYILEKPEEAIKVEMAIYDEESKNKAGKETGEWSKLLEKGTRIRVLSGVLVTMANQLSGANLIIMFSNKLFSTLTENFQVLTTIIGVLGIVGNSVNLIGINCIGRKSGLLIGSLMQGATMVCIFAAALLQNFEMMAISLTLFVFFYTGATYPFYLVYNSEILRGAGLSLCLGINSLLKLMHVQVGAYLADTMAKEILLALGAISLVLFFLMDYFCIETRGKSFLEIVEEFRNMKPYVFLRCLRKGSGNRIGTSKAKDGNKQPLLAKIKKSFEKERPAVSS